MDNRIASERKFFALQRKYAREYHQQFFRKDLLIKKYHNLVEEGKIKSDKLVESLLRVRSVRSLSGVVSISVLTKPYKCPGHCLYCPNQPGMPKSYLKEEPAVQRAVANNFDPYMQVQSRIRALEAIGHQTGKISIRIVGGTWSYYGKRYQTWFVRRLFQACNDFPATLSMPVSLCQAQDDNEKSVRRVVEMGVETRQDFINHDEIKRLRWLGITKVELGVQSIHDDVLKKNNRGNLNIDTINATKMLKNAGFKVSYQMMPNLYGSSIIRDEKMFQEIFSNEEYMPDHLKIYPLAVMKEAPLYKLYEEKRFKIYSNEELMNLIIKIKQIVPYWCRIERVIRDIPAKYIMAGCKTSNMRQLIHEKMREQGVWCKCMRCREIRKNQNYKDLETFREDFISSGSRESFLSIESKDRKDLYAILRLRLPGQKDNFIKILNDSAIVRELHVYGRLVSISQLDTVSAQHKGLGRKLVRLAEKIARDAKCKKISVIAGVGARPYFRALGYELKNTYMVKSF